MILPYLLLSFAGLCFLVAGLTVAIRLIFTSQPKRKMIVRTESGSKRQMRVTADVIRRNQLARERLSRMIDDQDRKPR